MSNTSTSENRRNDYKKNNTYEVTERSNEDRLIMQRSLMTLPSLNRQLICSGLKHFPTRVQTASITSLKLNKQPLPKQPVPDLKKTAERYLRSVKPLLSADEYKCTESVVKEFLECPGPELQCKLQERFEKTDNWMNEWFLKSAYLCYRVPVIVHSSPGTVGPPQKFSSPDDLFIFAGRLIGAICDYNKTVKSGGMKQEMARKDPLDMQPYALILGTHRRPVPKCDKLLHTDESKHIIVMNNNHLFKLDVVDDCGTPIPETKLTASLKDLYDRSATEALPVGILTGNCRETWAKDHAKLKEAGCNAKILEEIEGSLFILCLDKEVPKNKFKDKNEESRRALQSLTGVSSDTNAGNRWHDKIVQYIVSCDGFMGMEYEHSPCEGVPVAVLHDHVLKYISSKKNEKTCDESKDFPKAESLKFEVPADLMPAIENAKCAVDELSADIDMVCFTFKDFGSNAIKKGKMSPDSFIQMAMQATYYILHQKPTAHYESAALRRFTNARTECIRSTSVESVAFAEAMACETTPKEEKKEAMMKAINKHKTLAGEAAMGEGVDRHFFGLRTVAQNEGMDVPALYKDAGFTKSTHFKITSSQVPYKSASFMCYGPVVPDGYGCCYNPRADDIRIACSSFNSCKETCTQAFADTMKNVLCQMMDLSTSKK